MITSIVLWLLLAVLLIVGSAIATFFIDRKNMNPQVFMADDHSGYGLKAATRSRKWVSLVGITCSTFIELARSLRSFRGAKVTPWLYRRAEMESWVTDPTAVDATKITRSTTAAYLAERAIVIQQLISEMGWRSCLVNYVIEMPSTDTTTPQTYTDTDGKTHKVPQLRKTKFILY